MVYVNITGAFARINSFFIVANNLRAWIEPDHVVTMTRIPDWRANIRFYIGEIHNPFTRPRSWWYWIDVWWLDTAMFFKNLNYEIVIRHRPSTVFWLTSMWNAKMVANHEKLLREKKLVIVHRLLHPVYFLEWNGSRKEYDFIGIFTNMERKNVAVFRKICRETKAKCLEISPVGDVKTWSLRERDKIKLLLKAKWLVFPSKAEGFGMPVLESNILGVPALFTDGHAVKEFGCGIPLPVKRVRYVKELVGTFEYHEVDEEKAVELAKKALSLSKDEYQNLSMMCKEHARLSQESYIHYVLDYIDGIRR